jgi:hypothetical protein
MRHLRVDARLNSAAFGQRILLPTRQSSPSRAVAAIESLGGVIAHAIRIEPQRTDIEQGTGVKSTVENR